MQQAILDEVLETFKRIAGQKIIAETEIGYTRDRALLEMVRATINVKEIPTAFKLALKMDNEEHIAECSQWFTQAGSKELAITLVENISGSMQARGLAHLGEIDRVVTMLEASKDNRMLRMNPMILESMVKANHLDEALRLVQTLKNSMYIDYLRAIASALVEMGKINQATKIIEDISLTSADIDNSEKHVYYLYSLGRDFLEVGQLDKGLEIFKQALTIAPRIEKSRPRRLMLGNIAAELVKIGEGKLAWEIIEELKRDRLDEVDWRSIAVELTAANQLDKALELAAFFEGSSYYYKILIKIVQQLALLEQIETGFEIANRIPDEDKYWALYRLACALAKQGQILRALHTLDTCDPETFIITITRWAPFFEAVQPYLSIKVLKKIAPLFNDHHYWSEIFPLLDEISI